jgi:hypothetical protein
MEAKSMYIDRGGLWWNELFLPLTPVLYGTLTAFTNIELLYGPLTKEKLFVRFMWGGGVGWFSGVLYKGVSKMIKSKTGIDIEPGSTTTPPAPPAA